MHDQIVIKGARLHNLKDITIAIPKNKLVVITGLSGSGKSTLVFDILHMEGQRQYMESLGVSRETLQKPEVDTIEGLAPSIAVEQGLANRSPRSTVGTITEIFTYLRLLYARVGHRPCPNCGNDIPPPYLADESEAWDDTAETNGSDATMLGGDTYPCPTCGTHVPQLSMAHFSFNTPMGACPTCTGLGTIHEVAVDRLIDENQSVIGGGVLIWPNQMMTRHHSKVLEAAGQHYGFDFDVNKPIKELGAAQRDLLLHGATSPEFTRHYPKAKPPKSVSAGNFEGVIASFLRRYEERADDAAYREEMEKQMVVQVCPACHGDRLRPESLQVTVNGMGILPLSRQTLNEVDRWLQELPKNLSAEELSIARAMIENLSGRVQRLIGVGVGYLSLERSAPTLSGGEAQRLRLAMLLGSGLTGVLYVLDEPTTGLHQRDNALLIESLRHLRDQGNTVLVIEHDLEIVQAADHVIEMGPGAGEEGGEVIANGSLQDLTNNPQSITGRYVSGAASVPASKRRRVSSKTALRIRGAREHNLKNITVDLPLGGLIAVTGVSGSGKSTLMLDILDPAARQRFYGAMDTPGAHDAIEGWQNIDKVITIDQTPIGRTPRSNAATYTDAFDPIRKAFAATDTARQNKLKAEHFSFNVAGGRCERCEGAGVLSIKMHFLPDMLVRCPVCHGRRFKPEVLEVKYNGSNISQVLDMTIRDALEVFRDLPAVASKLSVLVDVGLGYLRLGQPATTLSGGEIQRVKLARELARRSTGKTLYLLDEPTTGLHVADIARLIDVLQRLVDAGNTIMVIEHNLDMIEAADWIVDLGPGGGSGGGQIVAEGPPELVAEVGASPTGQALRERYKHN